MKRTKQIEDYIEYVNAYCKNNNIANQYDDRIILLMDYLLKRRMYKGFNFFKRKDYTDVVGNVTTIDIITTEEEAEFIQIY